MLRGLVNWLSLRDYDDQLRDARLATIQRYARRNVSFQNGDVLDETGLDELTKSGDQAIADLSMQLVVGASYAGDQRL